MMTYLLTYCNRHDFAQKQLNADLLSRGFEYVREHGSDRVWVNRSWWRSKKTLYGTRKAHALAALPSPLTQVAMISIWHVAYI